MGNPKLPASRKLTSGSPPCGLEPFVRRARGTLRLFAIPGFEGDVRLVMVVDEQAPRSAYACGTHAARMRYAATKEKTPV